LSRGPEANLWAAFKAAKPKDALAMRIENRAGGGYPDCTIVLGGLPFWVELKANKIAKLQISPHQIAWHTSLCAHGGLSFFLVKPPAPRLFHLFRGSQAVDLAQKPISEVRGASFGSLGEVWDELRAGAGEHFAKFAKSG
jgi:hypothetical protein